MKKIPLFILLLLLSIALDSCKKGEDDPLFSARSRKNRIVGKWKLTSGYYEQSDNSSGSNVFQKYTLGEFGAHLYFSINNAQYYGFGSDDVRYNEKFEFKKDGSFTHYMLFDFDTWEEKGQWNFTGKVGNERKNKSELLLMFNESVTNYYGKETWDGEVNSFVYTIIELRHKRLILDLSWKYYDHVDQKYLYFTEHKVFEPDQD